MTESSPHMRGDAEQPVDAVPPWGTADGRDLPRQRPAAPEPPVVPAWGTPPAQTQRRRAPRRRTISAWIVAGVLVAVGAITSTSESGQPDAAGQGSRQPAAESGLVQPAAGEPDVPVTQPAPLAAGICLQDLTLGADGVPQAVDCTVQHGAEVFQTTQLRVRGRYPGDLTVNAQVERLCKARLRRLVPSRPDLGLVGSAPREGNWRIGKARVVCIAVLPHPAAGRFVPTN